MVTKAPRHEGQRLLIIDDDAQLVTMLAELLRLDGYDVATAADGRAGLRAIDANAPDLVVLDVMMPGIDGFETLAAIRARHDVPVLMLTARGDTDDRITGLEGGADDYLPKPFNPRELLLRIGAILRRGRDGGDGGALDFHGVHLDRSAMQASVDGEPLALTGAELRVLEGLLREAGGIASRDALTQFALGRKRTPYDRALDTHISNLRQKLGGDESPVEIRNVRGTGYALLPRSAGR